MTLAVTAVVGIATGLTWLLRIIFTSQKKIEMLEKDLEARTHQRDEDREVVHEVRESVKRIEGVLMGRQER